MPIEVVNKEETKPTNPYRHRALVPLRVMCVNVNAMTSPAWREGIEKYVMVDDILFVVPDHYNSQQRLFNCRVGSLVPPQVIEAISVVRAYHVKQIVLHNDEEPAPVL